METKITIMTDINTLIIRVVRTVFLSHLYRLILLPFLRSSRFCGLKEVQGLKTFFSHHVMSGRENESKCQSTAFLLVNIQI